MTQMIELPAWFVLLAGLLAIAGGIDRILVPGVRWMMLKRVNKAIDDLNSRLHLKIQPFKLSKRDGIIDRMLLDPELLKAIELEVIAKGEPRSVVLARVQKYAKEIVPNFSAATYFKFGAAASRIVSQAFYKVRLGFSKDDRLKDIDPDSTVVFVMNHRSNMDYVLVTYLASTASALSYAVGEWARVFALQTLIRSMGAYFIRRDSGDPLYRKVLARYVQIATEEGVTQAVFPEGGLSKDGALRPVKLGLLSYILAKFNPAGERDIVFIPVGINYDRVIEDRNLTGVRGQKSTSKAFFKSIKRRFTGQFYRLGYAGVSFGEPLSMRGFVTKNLKTLPETERFIEIEKIGQELMRRIAAVIPVLPVALVSRVMLEGNFTALEIKSQVAGIVENLLQKGIHVHIPRADLEYAVDSGLRILHMRHLVIENDGVYEVVEKERKILDYYANSIRHYFTH
jgi:glycerol-3-phosphate O-acyltransferase